MTAKHFFSLFGISSVALLMQSCATNTVFEQSASGENLSALQKVTESDNRCSYPFGGDNGRNLFFSVYAQNTSNIYKKESVNDASMSQKTSGKNYNVAPSYCSVTDQLAFASMPDGASAFDIYIINASQGSALIQVTNTPNDNENYPCLSKDGKLVVYEKNSYFGRNAETEIWLRNLQTNVNTLLGKGRTPCFSPDGQTVAYVQYAADGNTTCLWLMNTDGTNKNQLTNANHGSVWRPCFSPDGMKIVFQCTKSEKKDADLYMVDKSGNNMTQLTINKSFDGEPYWANDGYIYFTSDRGGRTNDYQIWCFKQQGAIGNSNSFTVHSSERQVTPSATKYHQVAKGETILEIAEKYGVKVRDILEWNELKTMTLKPGMQLKVSAQ